MRCQDDADAVSDTPPRSGGGSGEEGVQVFESFYEPVAEHFVDVHEEAHEFTDERVLAGDRTIDQMVQAARSGKQNIAEGAKASRMA
ncbi:MAG TPA: hypothetical protein VG796_24755 [Verrucomicrobiales bacterium]|nr:hypothetical protein [Verrucomicrobiales bacterium]